MIPDKSRGPDFSGVSVDPSHPLVLVLTTWPAGHTSAATFAERFVRDGLAACITRLPAHEAVYAWEGRVEQAAEQQWVIKTTPERLPALAAALHAAHPYDVPEWIVLPAQASVAYAAWVHASCPAPAG